MNIKDLENYLKQFFMITRYENGLVINSNIFCETLDDDDFPILITENGENIFLSDNGLTYERLLEKEINLEDEDIFKYVKNVLNTFFIGFNTNTKEFFVRIKDIKNINLSISRLLQALILISYIELQFEEE